MAAEHRHLLRLGRGRVDALVFQESNLPRLAVLASAYVVREIVAASHEWPAPLATLASAPTLN
jgi:hypothetical protein